MVRLHRKKLTETKAETLQVILLGAAKAPIKTRTRMAEADFQRPKGATPNISHSIGEILRGSFHLTGEKKNLVNESLGVGCHVTGLPH